MQCLYTAPDGALWVGTSGAGLCRYKEGRFATVGRAQGLPHGHICTILEDGLGFLWLSSRGGIFRVAKAELDRCADGLTTEVSCLAYGLGDGMPTLACSAGLQPAGCKTPDGRLWFPTAKGLVVVDPQQVKTGSVPPPVVLEAVLLDDHPVVDPTAPQAEVVVPPGRHRLEFQYAGLSFAAPERVRYKYRMAELETEWVDAGNKRSATYSHVPGRQLSFSGHRLQQRRPVERGRRLGRLPRPAFLLADLVVPPPGRRRSGLGHGRHCMVSGPPPPAPPAGNQRAPARRRG